MIAIYLRVFPVVVLSMFMCIWGQHWKNPLVVNYCLCVWQYVDTFIARYQVIKWLKYVLSYWIVMPIWLFHTSRVLTWPRVQQLCCCLNQILRILVPLMTWLHLWQPCQVKASFIHKKKERFTLDSVQDTPSLAEAGMLVISHLQGKITPCSCI